MAALASSHPNLAPAERFERLDYADRWLGDAFVVLGEKAPGFTLYVDVDMTHSKGLIDRMRAQGIRGTYTAVLLRACGLALRRHPELHQLLSGSLRWHLNQVDLGLSVANEAVAAPVLRLADVGQKTLPSLCTELAERVPAIRKQDSEILAKLRKWGWLVPTRFLRRLLLRLIFSSLRMNRNLAGSLQVTVLPGVDVVVPYLFSAPAVLAMGKVCERVVARDGVPAVRTTATLSCTADHRVWDGYRCAVLLAEISKILESGELETEALLGPGTPNTAMMSVSSE